MPSRIHRKPPPPWRPNAPDGNPSADRPTRSPHILPFHRPPPLPPATPQNAGASSPPPKNGTTENCPSTNHRAPYGSSPCAGTSVAARGRAVRVAPSADRRVMMVAAVDRGGGAERRLQGLRGAGRGKVGRGSAAAATSPSTVAVAVAVAGERMVRVGVVGQAGKVGGSERHPGVRHIYVKKKRVYMSTALMLLHWMGKIKIKNFPLGSRENIYKKVVTKSRNENLCIIYGAESRNRKRQLSWLKKINHLREKYDVWSRFRRASIGHKN